VAGNTSYVTASTALEPLGRVVRASDVPDAPPGNDWLIERIWREGGVGIIGGPPKGLKTWVVAEMAIAIASGTPFAGVYEVKAPGPVLAFFAEDSLADIKFRLASLCSGRGTNLATLDIRLIDASALLLNNAFHFRWLEEQVKAIHPRSLMLDPFVRIFRGNEDDAGQVAAVLGLLRKLQRDHSMAVSLVHHARKGATTTSGAALRGSGDLHAWGDSNLYLTPTSAGSRIVVEHRSARAPDPFTIGLTSTKDGSVTGLGIVDDDDRSTRDDGPALDERVLACLKDSDKPLGLTDLQTRLHVGRTRLSETLDVMEDAGRLERDGAKFRLRIAPGGG